MTIRFQYQSLTKPLVPIADSAETITVDKWYKQLERPRPKPKLVWVNPNTVEPPSRTALEAEIGKYGFDKDPTSQNPTRRPPQPWTPATISPPLREALEAEVARYGFDRINFIQQLLPRRPQPWTPPESFRSHKAIEDETGKYGFNRTTNAQNPTRRPPQPWTPATTSPPVREALEAEVALYGWPKVQTSASYLVTKPRAYTYASLFFDSSPITPAGGLFDIGWLAMEPVIIRPPARRPQPYFFEPPSRLALEGEIVKYGFGSYPGTMPRWDLKRQQHLNPTAFFYPVPLGSPPVTPFEWYVEAADVVRRAKNTLPTMGGTMPPSIKALEAEISKYGFGSYPGTMPRWDVKRRQHLNPTAFFHPVPQGSPAVTPFEWYVEAADVVRRANNTLPTMGGTMPPSITALEAELSKLGWGSYPNTAPRWDKKRQQHIFPTSILHPDPLGSPAAPIVLDWYVAPPDVIRTAPRRLTYDSAILPQRQPEPPFDWYVDQLDYVIRQKRGRDTGNYTVGIVPYDLIADQVSRFQWRPELPPLPLPPKQVQAFYHTIAQLLLNDQPSGAMKEGYRPGRRELGMRPNKKRFTF